jgi:flagellar biosynthetic protein FliQ
MIYDNVVDLSHEALWVIIKVSFPILLVALFVGLIVSLFQALTQIQEPTLSFVPKILAVFFIIFVTMNFVGSTLNKYSEEIMMAIENID